MCLQEASGYVNAVITSILLRSAMAAAILLCFGLHQNCSVKLQEALVATGLVFS
jgi:hypothetical protein